jgi:hypothetical protein
MFDHRGYVQHFPCNTLQLQSSSGVILQLSVRW